MNTRHAATAVLVSILALFVSCGGQSIRSAKAMYSRAVPLHEALENKDINPDVRRMLELALDVADFGAGAYGLKKEVSLLRYHPGSSDHLSWRLVLAPPNSVRASSASYFTDRAQAEARGRKAADSGSAWILQAADSLRWAGSKPSPMIDAYKAWPYENIVEWVFSELFASACASARSSVDLDGFAVFAAEKATIAFLVEKLSPSSAVLSRYISSRRDARTFGILFRDYRIRFDELYSQDPPPPDTQKRRDFMSATWLAEYQASYSNRFLTNNYLYFVTDPASNTEMAAWEDPYAVWSRWETLFRDEKENLRKLVEKTLPGLN